LANNPGGFGYDNVIPTPYNDGMRTSKPITVTLGNQQRSLEKRLESGAFASASEVLRAAMRALDREENALDAVLRQRIAAAIDDPRPSIPADDVFAALRAFHAAGAKGRSGGA